MLTSTNNSLLTYLRRVSEFIGWFLICTFNASNAYKSVRKVWDICVLLKFNDEFVFYIKNKGTRLSPFFIYPPPPDTHTLLFCVQKCHLILIFCCSIVRKSLANNQVVWMGNTDHCTTCQCTTQLHCKKKKKINVS